MPDVRKFPAVEVNQHDKTFYLTRLSAGLLVRIAYASVRGVDQEPGAVQRYLNSRRINSIKEFTIKGGHYPASIVLNWVNNEQNILFYNGTLSIPNVERSAQLIDGQHRVAGIKAAVEDNSSLADFEIPVAIYSNLTTQECANIFLSINTEQKPVARTLVFDLYGIANEQFVDAAGARARDIAMALNDDDDSPYFQQIKLPGSQRRKGGIALSTAVSALKPLVEEKGDFEQRGIYELEVQVKIIKNIFRALMKRYEHAWYLKENAFMYAAGFVGAIEFFRTRLISYADNHKNFTEKFFYDAIEMDSDDLIRQEEVKGKGGKEAPLIIQDRLNSMFQPLRADETEIRV